MTNTQPASLNPGKAFGKWLKSMRQAKGIIARIFAGQVWLSPSKYAEVELGVVRWIGGNQETIIPILLNLAKKEHGKFKKLLKAARSAIALTFDTVLNVDDLRPVRMAHSQGRQITKLEEDDLMKLVFKPLPA